MTKIKVLIIGPDFYSYNKSISDAFIKFGYQTLVFTYDEKPITSIEKSIRNKIAYRFSSKKILENHYKTINFNVLKNYYSYNADIVFVVKGDILYNETVEKMKTSKTILWMMDSVLKIPKILQSIQSYDYRIVFEKKDVDYLQKIGINSNFVPLAFDEEIYFPNSIQIKDIDIFFVGNLYPERRKTLQNVVKSFNKYNIKIFGKYLRLNAIGTYFNYYVLNYKKYFTNQNISSTKVNEFYNRSKIILNIHHKQSQDGCNPRVFEILGSRGFQIVDNNNYISKEFNLGEDLVVYYDEKDLIKKIHYFIHNIYEREKISKNGYSKVLLRDTFCSRINDILKISNENI